MLVTISVLSYSDHLKMGTDTSLDDLSCTLDYTADRSHLTTIFWWDSN